MAFKDSFFVTLPSNVKNVGNKINTVANYTTYLPTRLILDGDWEVGIAEISYSLSWYNIKRKCPINLVEYNATKTVKDKALFHSGRYLEPGRYDSIEELIKKISDIASEYMKKEDGTYPALYEPPVIEYDKLSRKITITHGRGILHIVYLLVDDYLAEKLGLNIRHLKQSITKKFDEYKEYQYSGKSVQDHPKATKEIRKTRTTRPIELDAGCKSLNVYSNIVRESFVGDTTAPILRLVEVPTSAKYGDQIVLPYPSPHYLPVSSNDIQSIEIDIKDDTNERIPFEFGRTTIKLHFRRKL